MRRASAEQVAVGVEGPGLALGLDAQGGLVGSVEEALRRLAVVVTVGERHRLVTVPTLRNNGHGAVRDEPREPDSGLQVLETSHGGKLLPCRST
jgi:hypothetical protein